MTQTNAGERFTLEKLRIACSECSVQDFCLPFGLNNTQLAELETITEHLGPIQENSSLFRAGDPLRYLFAVHSGSFKTVGYNKEGEKHLFGFHLPGDLMGLDGIYPSIHQCEAVALEMATVCRFEYTKLTDITAQIPALQKQLFRLMSKDIQHSESQNDISSSHQKLASFLVDWSKRQENFGNSARHFVLPMSRQDIGDYLGLAPETVSRALRHLIDERVIAIDKHEVWLLDRTALDAL